MRAVCCVGCTAVSNTRVQVLEALEATRVVIRSKGRNGGSASKALGPALKDTLSSSSKLEESGMS
jgi:hypothetical protein